jgi:similar to spore coat protein
LKGCQINLKKPGGAGMANKELAMHEKLEVHEILQIKSACVAKSAMMQGLASDKKLKELLEEDVKKSKKVVEELKDILS